MSTAVQTIALERKRSTGEWVVVVRIDGKRIEAQCYYTTDLEDAKATLSAILSSMA